VVVGHVEHVELRHGGEDGQHLAMEGRGVGWWLHCLLLYIYFVCIIDLLGLYCLFCTLALYKLVNSTSYHNGPTNGPKGGEGAG
jgi:hypothetical protein